MWQKQKEKIILLLDMNKSQSSSTLQISENPSTSPCYQCFPLFSWDRLLGITAKEQWINCVFSDIDGTLVHYPEDDISNQEGDDPNILYLPPSSSGMRGIISVKTLQLARGIQQKGVPFILVSAVRYSTFMNRINWLPNANAYIIENGGRIFWNRSAPTGNLKLEEDMVWRRSLEPQCVEVEKCCRDLKAEGWSVDTTSYETMFRVKLKDTDTMEDLKALLKRRNGISYATNLGYVDIFPSRSGKKNAAKFVANSLGMQIQKHCTMICDDDNDMPLALEMGQGAYITRITAPSVMQEIDKQPHHFIVSNKKDTLASEELLTLIKKKCRRKNS